MRLECLGGGWPRPGRTRGPVVLGSRQFAPGGHGACRLLLQGAGGEGQEETNLILSHGRRGSPPLAAGPAHLRRPGRSATQVPAGDNPARATLQKGDPYQGDTLQKPLARRIIQKRRCQEQRTPGIDLARNLEGGLVPCPVFCVKSHAAAIHPPAFSAAISRADFACASFGDAQ